MSQDSQQTESSSKMGLPSTSTFSFTAPFPPTTTTTGPQGTLKQRRVSLALPRSPKLVPTWNFRDDTAVESHVTSSSPLVPEKKGKMRKVVSDEQKNAAIGAAPVPEKRQRKKWTEEETQMLVTGCNTWGVGNWKAILNDRNLKFDNRSPVDLKDRFRTFFPDAYKLHYPNAKTHLSSKVRSTLPDGTSLFEKTRSKKRRPFTSEEDQALKAGYEKYGTVWSTIVKDPIFQEQKRRSTDLRDRFRNAFPHLYQAAGYKPRSIPKKRRGDMSAPPPPRAAADDQFVPSRLSNPARRRRSRTTPGYSYSVPQSTTNSDDEDSSEDEDDDVEAPKPITEVKEATPQAEEAALPQTMLDEVTMHTIDQADPLGEFIPEMSQSLYESTDQSTWSSENSPPQIDTWSSAATTTTTSPTSSHMSMNENYFVRDSFDTLTRRDGLNMIGKSAWGPSDWMSPNPRLDASGASTSSNSSLIGGPSPPPSSPFSFSHLSHYGIMDRYDLFQNSYAHDYASEVGVGDTGSIFSDPELFPSQSMRGFTHHSDYAGDLIFGARTHQPQVPMNSFGNLALGLSGLGQSNLAQDSGGLGLTGMAQSGPSTSIDPMQLHSSFSGIEELELMAIRLDDIDDEPMITTSTAPSTTTAEVGVQKDDSDTALLDAVDLSSLIHLPPQTLEEIAGLSAESSMEADTAATPPATPAQSSRAARELHASGSQYSSFHSRSMSVPPFERERLAQRPIPQGLATPQPGPTRSLSLYDIHTSQTETEQTPLTTSATQSSSVFSLNNDHLRAIGADLSDLMFLDLQHRFEAVVPAHDLMDPIAEEARKGLALDLARTSIHSTQQGTLSSFAFSSAPLTPSAGGRPSLTHHRGQSAVSPKDLQLQSVNDNKRKRASWDGGTSEMEFVNLT